MSGKRMGAWSQKTPLTPPYLVPSHGLQVAHLQLASPVLAKDERGIIVSPPVEITPPNNVFIRSTAMDPQELRMALLMWDRLDWPSNNGIHLDDPSTSFLVAEGVLTRSSVRFGGGGEGADFLIKAQLAVFEEYERTMPGKWAVARGINSLSVFEKDGVYEERALLVDLHRAIPVPDKDVPYPDVLEFRHKRRDEWLALRILLEELFQEICQAPDKPLAEATAFLKIENATRNLQAVTVDAGMRSVRSSLRSTFSLNTLANEAFKPLLAACVGGAIFSELAAGVAVGMAVEFAKSIRKGRACNPMIGTPYEYAYRFHHELKWVE
jgi:hypothetical protein